MTKSDRPRKGPGQGAPQGRAQKLRFNNGRSKRRRGGWRDREALSAREQQVASCLLSRASDKEIAEQLQISELTVRRHLANLFTKLGVHDREAAAVRYVSFSPFALLSDSIVLESSAFVWFSRLPTGAGLKG